MYKRLIGVALALLFLGMVGCASAPKKKEPLVFFPPAPELPRIQFLTSYSGMKDVETQSSFNRFVTGEKRNLRLDKPYGVGIYDGKIYVCDTNSTVVIFDLKKKTFGFLEAATAGQGKLTQPLNISIQEDGTKYVTDPVRAQVVVFDKDDQYVRAYGTPENWRPVDAVPFEDRLYVVDIANGLIKVFDKASGDVVKTIGDKGEPSQRLDRPTNLAFDRDGYMYVTDVARFQVLKYDRDGHYKAAFGKPGDNLGHFARPKGIAVDQEGQIYVVDAAFNNVQVFNKEGRLLLFFGSGGKEAGQFFLPAKVVVDYKNMQYFQKYADPNFKIEYLVLVTSQFEKRSVSILAYGKEKGKRYPTEEELKRLIEEQKKKAAEKQEKS
jgi:DNA-binding beta-propeller fold protein YncE